MGYDITQAEALLALIEPGALWNCARSLQTQFDSTRVLFWGPGVFLGGTGKIRIYFIAINFQRVEAAGTTGNFGK